MRVWYEKLILAKKDLGLQREGTADTVMTAVFLDTDFDMKRLKKSTKQNKTPIIVWGSGDLVLF